MDTSEHSQPQTLPFSTGRFILYLIFGTLLPAFALGFEIVTGLSDNIYINPIPNLYHAILIGMTPIIIALNAIRCFRKQPIRKWDLHLNSLCLGVTSVYAIVYLPIAPFAAIGVAFYGLGFLPLSPLISLLCAYRIRKEMKHRVAEQWPIGLRHLAVGFLLGITLLCCGSIPRIITDYGIAQYGRVGTKEDHAAIRLLRTFGSEKALLNACYQQSEDVFFWGGSRNAVSTEEARQLYYRVTGESFNANRKEQEFFAMRGRTNDRDLGGEHVGQRIDDIHLEESRLDGILEPELGTGYVEWTMVFRNDDEWQQHEARMLIAIPTGGVASRVTLWVNGEPREAAFGSKAKVRAAYQSVAVRQRRDPILVNWAGPDLLLAQCFPIQPDGGKMKVRIGISFPLEADSHTTLAYRYPTIVAENFTISDQLKHSVWYEEKTSGGVLSHAAEDMTMRQLHSTRSTIQATAHPLLPSFTSTHPTHPNETITFTTKLPKNESVAAPNAIVIDGSRAMRNHKNSIAKWASHYNGTLQLYFASDEVRTFQGNGKACAKWIQQQDFVGGQDNVPALTEAIRALLPSASAETPQTLFWFSGPQPIQLSGTEKIRQLFERRELHLDIVACLTSRDYNALYELAPLSYCNTLQLDTDGNLQNPTITFEPAESSATAPRGSSHAYRAWLANQTRTLAERTYSQQARLGAARFKSKIAELADKAAEAYLVTQISGAVVLETDRQYKENDLEAGDPSHTPTVPEARHYALILGICTLGYRLVQRRPRRS
ncbi:MULTISPECIES: VIT domain-containing protein [unclassified Lentimonas]|uniref:VIT domain-containing protein n=1 Tax=unclassified Lentimonas TaxID=2630993 RepID=UPI001324E9FF|nr:MULTISPECIES: VIT domain-containing protein [unclassified Lentimonas]CAA6696757.1 Unannotated [Lentimonas sp. CC10]CAA6697286.1 Unannotated [Lentimonas sp. CC19]CAA7072278.1 Unannotated [Lentimonas sp. CC11]